MNTIVPHLWFDHEAHEAADLYVSLFPNSRIISTNVLKDTPSGDTEVVDFELAGQPFGAISAGPYFKLNPAISLTVACDSAAEVDALWKVLSDGGVELMPLDTYPFSKRYAWVQDRYGLSWQLMLTEGENPLRKIVPSLLFSGAALGKAEDAVHYYTSVFENSGVDLISRYAEGEALMPEAKINYAAFRLLGQPFTAMDHGFEADFTFNEAFSLIVYCDTQAEIDFYWQKLSHVPEAEACGWLKDQFGVSWQVVPTLLDTMMENGTEEQIQRVTEVFLQMKKFDIAALEKAFAG